MCRVAHTLSVKNKRSDLNPKQTGIMLTTKKGAVDEESFVFPRQIGTLVVLVVVCGDAFVPVLKRQNSSGD